MEEGAREGSGWKSRGECSVMDTFPGACAAEKDRWEEEIEIRVGRK
jgi:hypothetical protein